MQQQQYEFCQRFTLKANERKAEQPRMKVIDLKGPTVELYGLTEEDIQAGFGIHLPELGPERGYTRHAKTDGGVILPIAGRTWRVKYHFAKHYDGGYPDAGSVEFEISNQPEQTYDILPLDFELHNNYKIIALGQPFFKQQKWFPHLNGICASHLMTLNTGWGDSGNINLFINLDDKGIPIALWQCADCC